MKTFSIPAAILFVSVACGAEPLSLHPYESENRPTAGSRIDELVLGNLRRLKVEPSPLCSDEVFVRRVFLDCIGTLPTAEEARAFLRDRDPEKRRKLIDRLLDRDEFADYWAMKWCDILRVKSEFPINLWPNAVQAYHRWIRTAVKENMPYDKFAREMLTAGGSNFRVPPVNFYRAMQNREPEAIAGTAALTFMGVRIKHWPEARRKDMAVFFSRVGFKQTAEWKEEIVYFDRAGVDGGEGTIEAVFPDGKRIQIRADEDPRQAFADWLTGPKNRWFARNMANRAWYWLLGRGIIHEPDDLRTDNKPCNPQLLAYLERELIDSKYDVKRLYRLILNSNTYQLSPIPRSDRPHAEAQFAYYAVRRLEAEVLIDALCQITGTTESYSSLIPEPFTFVPESQRTITLADGSISSSFLDMFGRPPRDTGLLEERDNSPSAAQRLHFLNSSHVRNKIERSEKIRKIARSARNPRDGIDELYLTILSRYPTPAEIESVRAHAAGGRANRGETVFDLAWALFNTAEFQYRH